MQKSPDYFGVSRASHFKSETKKREQKVRTGNLSTSIGKPQVGPRCGFNRPTLADPHDRGGGRAGRSRPSHVRITHWSTIESNTEA